MGNINLRLNRGLQDALSILGLYFLTINRYICHGPLLFLFLFIKYFAEQTGTKSACQLVIHLCLQGLDPEVTFKPFHQTAILDEISDIAINTVTNICI